MKNIKYYIYPTISFCVFFALIAILAANLIVKFATISLLNEKIEQGQQQVKNLQSLLAQNQTKIIEQQNRTAIQRAIQNTGNQSLYLSIIDWSGAIVCHPDVTKIGSKSDQKASIVSRFENSISGKDLYTFLNTELSNNYSNVFYSLPIKESDWIVAVHLNKEILNEQTNDLKTKITLSFLIIGLVLLLFILIIIRWISGIYDNQLLKVNSKIEDDLKKLNISLQNYQENISEFAKASQKDISTSTPINSTKEHEKKRILTYSRNELRPVNVEDIAYIFVDNTITYLIQKNGQKSTSQETLDGIYAHLNDKLFFRVNRQIIVCIYAISKIIKYDNNKLKIETSPSSEIDIIIGKNKASAFKQWLDI